MPAGLTRKVGAEDRDGRRGRLRAVKQTSWPIPRYSSIAASDGSLKALLGTAKAPMRSTSCGQGGTGRPCRTPDGAPGRIRRVSDRSTIVSRYGSSSQPLADPPGRAAEGRDPVPVEAVRDLRPLSDDHHRATDQAGAGLLVLASTGADIQLVRGHRCPVTHGQLDRRAGRRRLGARRPALPRASRRSSARRWGLLLGSAMRHRPLPPADRRFASIEKAKKLDQQDRRCRRPTRGRRASGATDRCRRATAGRRATRSRWIRHWLGLDGRLRRRGVDGIRCAFCGGRAA